MEVPLQPQPRRRPNFSMGRCARQPELIKPRATGLVVCLASLDNFGRCWSLKCSKYSQRCPARHHEGSGGAYLCRRWERSRGSRVLSIWQCGLSVSQVLLLQMFAMEELRMLAVPVHETCLHRCLCASAGLRTYRGEPLQIPKRPSQNGESQRKLTPQNPFHIPISINISAKRDPWHLSHWHHLIRSHFECALFRRRHSKRPSRWSSVGTRASAPSCTLERRRADLADVRGRCLERLLGLWSENFSRSCGFGWLPVQIAGWRKPVMRAILDGEADRCCDEWENCLKPSGTELLSLQFRSFSILQAKYKNRRARS